MALALDGTPTHANNGGASSLGLFVPATANAGDVILVAVTTNGGPVTSVTDNGGGALSAWTKFGNTGGGNDIELWYATAAGTISASSITVTVNNTSSAYITVDCWAVSGGDTSTVFDGSAVTGSSDPLQISTTVADTFIIGIYRFNSTSNPTAGGAFTQISGADFQLSEYKIVSATQTNLNVDVTTGNGNANGGVLAAIKIASGGGDTLFVGGGVHFI